MAWQVYYYDPDNRGIETKIATYASAAAAFRFVLLAPKRRSSTEYPHYAKRFDEVARHYIVQPGSGARPDVLIYAFHDLSDRQHSTLHNSIMRQEHDLIHMTAVKQRRAGRAGSYPMFGDIQHGRILLHYRTLDQVIKQHLQWYYHGVLPWKGDDIPVLYSDVGIGAIDEPWNSARERIRGLRMLVQLRTRRA